MIHHRTSPSPLTAICVATLLASTSACSSKGSSAQASASPASASPASASASAAPAAGKLVHATIVKGECTFDFDAPEALKKADEDGVSVRYDGASFSFTGYRGAALDDFDNIAAMSKPEDRAFYDKDANPRLVVAREPKASKPIDAISGFGGEHLKDSTRDGCTFACSGAKEKEKDVVAMCKSVKIRFAEGKGSDAQ
jgi:hypothetical protein